MWQLNEIAKNRDVWTDQRIRETIEFVRHRLQHQKSITQVST